MQCDDIHIPLADDHGRLPAVDKIQPVQISALVEHKGLRGIQIFGLRVTHNPSAKGNYPVIPVKDREHNPVPELIIGAFLFIESEKSRLLEDCILISLFFHIAVQAGIRITKSELYDGLGTDSPACEIIKANPSSLRTELCVKIICRQLIHLQDHVPHVSFPTVLRGTALPGQFHSRLPGELLQRFHKSQILIFHQKSKHVAAGTAAKAVIHLFARTHRKGCRFFIVKRAQPHIAAASPFQIDIGRDHIHNIISLPDLFHKVFFVKHIPCNFLPSDYNTDHIRGIVKFSYFITAYRSVIPAIKSQAARSTDALPVCTSSMYSSGICSMCLI